MERASLVNKAATKKSKAVGGEPSGSEADSVDGFTKRVLLSMVFDISQLEKNVERIKVKVFTLAKAHGIVPPEASDDD